MLFSAALRTGVRSGIARSAPRVRHASSGPGISAGTLSQWYNIFGKSNAGYITWIIAGVLAAEFVTGFGIDTMWSSVNKGRLYESVDWQKFVVEDDDDDDDDDDDEDEDEDEDEEEEEEDDE